MRTIKECILERLKVTSKVDDYKPPTLREYYDLLDEYCKTNNVKLLDLTRVFDNGPLPPCEYNKKRVIFTIRPAYPSDPEIIIKVQDFALNNSFFYSTYVADTPDDEIDFMKDEYVEATVKYMKDHIK